MKNFYRLAVLCLSLVLIFSMNAMTAFAATEPIENEGLPADAVILYEEDGVTFYQSESQAKEDGIVTRGSDMDYAYAWIDPSDRQDGTLYISKTIWGTANITFKVESGYGGAYAQMTLRYKDGGYITTAAPRASATEDLVLDTTISSRTDYQIDYLCYNNQQGMRLLCWFWN